MRDSYPSVPLGMPGMASALGLRLQALDPDFLIGFHLP